MNGYRPETALQEQRLRQKGRAVTSVLPAATGRPAEWGPWEWRDWAADTSHPLVRDAIVRGHAPPRGLLRACLNAVYSVMFFQANTPWGTVDHLMIRRHDQGIDVSWVDKQRIKDELMGLDRTAVEVYPSRADLVDDANIYHLWVLPKDFALPFGLHL